MAFVFIIQVIDFKLLQVTRGLGSLIPLNTLDETIRVKSRVDTNLLCYLGGSVIKNPPVIQKGVNPWVGKMKIPWRRNWQFPVFLPGKSHGQKSLVGSQRVGDDLMTEQQLACWGPGKIIPIPSPAQSRATALTSCILASRVQM